MFTNRVVWITGASSGIGEALAARFARENARVVLSARRQPELERVRQHCIDAGAAPENMLALPLDVTDLPSLPVAADHVISHFGQIDLLINNAGLSQRSLCKDTDLSVYQTLLDVDVMGQIALTKAVLPHMLERQSGHLAVTASVAGKVGVPLRTGYCAAKHAVMGFFDALRAEVEDDGILVSTITPGFIRTDISRNAPGGRWLCLRRGRREHCRWHGRRRVRGCHRQCADQGKTRDSRRQGQGNGSALGQACRSRDDV